MFGFRSKAEMARLRAHHIEALLETWVLMITALLCGTPSFFSIQHPFDAMKPSLNTAHTLATISSNLDIKPYIPTMQASLRPALLRHAPFQFAARPLAPARLQQRVQPQVQCSAAAEDPYTVSLLIALKRSMPQYVSSSTH